MAGGDSGRRWRCWALALLWLPAGVVASALVRFGPGLALPELGPWLAMMVVEGGPSLVPMAPCGLPLVLGCRRLWRLGYRCGAWAAGAGLGTLTVAASLPAGLLGPIAIAVCAVVIALPAWGAWWWLARRGRTRRSAGRPRSRPAGKGVSAR